MVIIWVYLFLQTLCEKSDLIFIQEHWLQDCQLHLLDNVHKDFTSYGKSSMCKKLSQGLLRGRPFGGVAVLYRKSLCNFITCVEVDDDGRVVVIKIDNGVDCKLLCVGVYLPCDDHSGEYRDSIQQIYGFIDSVLCMNSDCKGVILGDFNFECCSHSFGYSALLPLAQDHCLELCHDVSSGSVDYTYAHVSLNQKSLIDHVFIHKDCKRLISNYVIVEDGTNMSDHLPICFQLQWSVQSGVVNVNKNMNVVVEHRWDKGDRFNYYLHTGYLLNKINHNFPCLSDGSVCNDVNHLHDIEIYYEEIIHCLQTAADTHIPRIPKSALKHYWSVALDDLKANSCAAHRTWISAGKPKFPVFTEKKSAHYKYKIAIKDAARAFESKFTDELLEHYVHKDLNRFWKSWKRLNNRGPVNVTQIDGLSDNFEIANKFAEYFQVNVASEQHLHYNLERQVAPHDCHEYMFDVENVELAINSNLKPGKAAGIDNIMAEHILNAHPAIITHLKTSSI